MKLHQYLNEQSQAHHRALVDKITSHFEDREVPADKLIKIFALITRAEVDLGWIEIEHIFGDYEDAMDEEELQDKLIEDVQKILEE